MNPKLLHNVGEEILERSEKVRPDRSANSEVYDEVVSSAMNLLAHGTGYDFAATGHTTIWLQRCGLKEPVNKPRRRGITESSFR